MRLSVSKTAIAVFLLMMHLHAQSESNETIKFTPIQHATLVIETTEATIFIDPVGDIDAFEEFSDPNIILITDIHGDHLDSDVVKALKKENTHIIAPKAVVNQLNEGQILNNGQTTSIADITIEAIPMYNLTAERMKFHEKGRGNGYVITADEKRIYISGDTEDIPEMRQLKDIDYAFVCMNLPYTMSVEQAASAVLEMKPKVVFPYHYRGTEGFSDIKKFKKLVNEDQAIEVRMLNWYQ